MKTINKVLNILRDYMATKGSVYGIEALGVFGSVARDQEREDSDVDVVIKLGKSRFKLTVTSTNMIANMVLQGPYNFCLPNPHSTFGSKAGGLLHP